MKYPGLESSTLEFKERIPEKQQIVKTILGFCNLYGGQLVIGVSDAGDVVGVDESLAEDLMASLSASILDSCTPHIIPRVHSQRIESKLVIVVDVASGMNKPYFLSSAGQEKGTFVRVGSRTVRASREMIEELKWQSRGRAYDELASYEARRDHLDMRSVQRILGHDSRKKVSDQVLFSHKLLVQEHVNEYPSIGGVLLFAKDPQQFLSEAFIICSHFAGSRGRDAVATKDCSGDLFEQVENVLDFVTHRLNRSFAITGRKREEKLEIPEVAVREAIVNAVVHRSYSIKGPIKVAIFDDRVEIFSPGIFPGPIDPQNLEAGITYIRNIVITKVFRAAGYMEKLGSGLLTIFDSYRQYGLMRPQIIEGSGFVKCVLPRQQQPVKSNDPADQIIALFAGDDELSTGELTRRLRISRASVVRYLNRFVDEGVLERIGKGRAIRYRLRGE